jgi:hypothetical protein
MQHTLSALTHTVMVHVGEQHRRTVREWGNEVFRLTGCEPQPGYRCGPLQLRKHGMLSHKAIQFVNRAAIDGPAVFPSQDFLSYSFPQLPHGLSDLASARRLIPLSLKMIRLPRSDETRRPKPAQEGPEIR